MEKKYTCAAAVVNVFKLGSTIRNHDTESNNNIRCNKLSKSSHSRALPDRATVVSSLDGPLEGESYTMCIPCVASY